MTKLDSKVLEDDIMNSIKPAQQKKVISGIDELVVEDVEVWRSLSGKKEY